jgi:hypothetical protein
MQKNVLLEMVKQNQFTSYFSFDRVTEENAKLRLNDKRPPPSASSIATLARRSTCSVNFWHTTEVKNTTIGQVDRGEHYDVSSSRELIERGYQMLQELVETSLDEDWLEPVDTPFFGTVSRARLFAHVLFHNSHHAGQISMTLWKGSA